MSTVAKSSTGSIDGKNPYFKAPRTFNKPILIYKVPWFQKGKGSSTGQRVAIDQFYLDNKRLLHPHLSSSVVHTAPIHIHCKRDTLSVRLLALTWTFLRTPHEFFLKEPRRFPFSQSSKIFNGHHPQFEGPLQRYHHYSEPAMRARASVHVSWVLVNQLGNRFGDWLNNDRMRKHLETFCCVCWWKFSPTPDSWTLTRTSISDIQQWGYLVDVLVVSNQSLTIMGTQSAYVRCFKTGRLRRATI